MITCGKILCPFSSFGELPVWESVQLFRSLFLLFFLEHLLLRNFDWPEIAISALQCVLSLRDSEEHRLTYT